MSQKTESQPERPYHHGDLRNALIQAGQELLTLEGAAGLDLRKVARRAGVSHAAPYRHFADKQALLAAIAEEGFRMLTDSIQTALDQAPDTTVLQLEAFARAYVDFALDSPARMREMFSGFTIDRAAYPTLYTTSKEAYAAITGVMQRGQERGELIVGDSNDLTLAAWSMIHGLAMLVIENQIPGALGDQAMINAMIDRNITILIDGLKPRERSTL